MTQRVYLHIGAMKSGTSYLQEVMRANRDTMAEAGCLVASHALYAVHDLFDSKAYGQEQREGSRGRWEEFRREVRDFEGPAAVLSNEFLSLRGLRYVDRLLADLAPAEVHVVLTVRDATATLAAQWYTDARNRGLMQWPDYARTARQGWQEAGLHGVRDHTFLYAQRPGRMVRAWAGKATNIHIVTVPASRKNPDILWERFCSALQLPVGAAPDREVPSNPSAGYPSTHLLPLLHADLTARGIDAFDRRRLVNFVASRSVARRDVERRAPMDRQTARFAARWNRRMVRSLQTSPAQLHGSYVDLPGRVQPSRVTSQTLDVPTETELRGATRFAVEAMADLSEDLVPAVIDDSSSTALLRQLGDCLTAALTSGATDRLTFRGGAFVAEEHEASSDEGSDDEGEEALV